jgi:hypothetical protein
MSALSRRAINCINGRLGTGWTKEQLAELGADEFKTVRNSGTRTVENIRAFLDSPQTPSRCPHCGAERLRMGNQK